MFSRGFFKVRIYKAARNENGSVVNQHRLAREYHEKYPDADYFDFAGLVAGERAKKRQALGEEQ
jgi:hypothetical protein